ncbi:MAG: hypothetical protein IJ523_10580 [Succinivibrionaceae bacterium]|nr:hypothetical protein [Succinivibrionaceae bacterium]
MNKENSPRYGAFVERGSVIDKGVTSQGNAWYVVESIDRPGVTTSRIQGYANLNAQVGSKVCFFMFDDGTGSVLSILE